MIVHINGMAYRADKVTLKTHAMGQNVKVVTDEPVYINCKPAGPTKSYRGGWVEFEGLSGVKHSGFKCTKITLKDTSKT